MTKRAMRTYFPDLWSQIKIFRQSLQVSVCHVNDNNRISFLVNSEKKIRWRIASRFEFVTHRQSLQSGMKISRTCMAAHEAVSRSSADCWFINIFRKLCGQSWYAPSSRLFRGPGSVIFANNNQEEDDKVPGTHITDPITRWALPSSKLKMASCFNLNSASFSGYSWHSCGKLSFLSDFTKDSRSFATERNQS